MAVTLIFFPVCDAGEELITVSHSERFSDILGRLRNNRVCHDIILLPYAAHSMTLKMINLSQDSLRLFPCLHLISTLEYIFVMQ